MAGDRGNEDDSDPDDHNGHDNVIGDNNDDSDFLL